MNHQNELIAKILKISAKLRSDPNNRPQERNCHSRECELKEEKGRPTIIIRAARAQQQHEHRASRIPGDRAFVHAVLIQGHGCVFFVCDREGKIQKITKFTVQPSFRKSKHDQTAEESKSAEFKTLECQVKNGREAAGGKSPRRIPTPMTPT